MFKSLVVFVVMLFSSLGFADGFPLNQVSFNGINFTMSFSDVSGKGFLCDFKKCKKDKNTLIFDNEHMKSMSFKVDYNSDLTCNDFSNDAEKSISAKYGFYQSYNHKALRAPHRVSRIINTDAGSVEMTVTCINNEYYDGVTTVYTRFKYVGLPGSDFSASLN